MKNSSSLKNDASLLEAGEICGKNFPDLELKVIRIFDQDSEPIVIPKSRSELSSFDKNFQFFFMPGFFFLNEKKREEPKWVTGWRRLDYASECKKMIEKIVEFPKLYAENDQVVIITNQSVIENMRILKALKLSTEVWMISDTSCDYSKAIGVSPF